MNSNSTVTVVFNQRGCLPIVILRVSYF